jgi:hypothetical protein
MQDYQCVVMAKTHDEVPCPMQILLEFYYIGFLRYQLNAT